MTTILCERSDGEKYVLPHLINSEEWFAWLKENKSFRYEGKTGFRCNKRKNGKWYAAKKIWASGGGKTVSLYVGDDSSCTREKLAEIDNHFSLPESDFWHWYYGQDRDRGKGDTQEKCTTSELDQLRSELEDLKDELKQKQYRVTWLENENARLERLKQDYGRDTVARLHNKYAKVLKENELLKEQRDGFKRQALKLRDELENNQLPPTSELGVAELLNKLRAENKRSKASLKDVEMILDLLGLDC